MAMTVTVGGNVASPTNPNLFLEAGSFNLDDQIGQRSACDFSLVDWIGAYAFDRGMPVTIVDGSGTLVFGGFVWSSKIRLLNKDGKQRHDVKCVDHVYLADKRVAAKAYLNTLAGDMVGDLLTSYLQFEGVLGTRAAPTFTRASAAYAPNGSTDPFVNQALSGVARYETGQLAASKAIRIEEATTNLFSANQSDVETNTTGFSAAASTLLSTGATISRDTAHKFAGAASLKIITTNATSGQGAEAQITSALANTKYAISVWLDGTGSQQWQLAVRDFTNSVQVTQNVTLGSDWTRVTLIITTGALAVTDLRVAIKTTAAVAQTVWADGWQIEAKAHATSWQVGGTPRAAETLKIPAYGLVNPQRGTLEFRAFFDANTRRQEAGSSPHLFGMNIAGAGGGIFLFHSDNTSNWVMGNSDGVNSDFHNIADSNTPDGWHKIIVGWDPTSLYVVIDTTLVVNFSNPHLPPKLDTWLYIGSDGVGSAQLGTLYQDIRISVKKRPSTDFTFVLSGNFATMDDVTSYLAPLNTSLAVSTSIEDGPIVNEATFNYVPCSVCIDRLAEVGQKWWNIDFYGLAHFRARGALVASSAIDGTVMEQEDAVGLDRAGPQYRNRQFMLGGEDQTSTQVETRIGDGTATAFTLSYPLAKVPTVEVKIGAGAFVAKTVGIKNVDTAKDWYWGAGDDVLAQDTGGVKLTSADILRVTYIGQFPLVYVAEDTSAVMLNQSAEGGSTTGYVDAVDKLNQTSTSAAAAQYAAGKLARYAQSGKALSFTTRQVGFRAGLIATVTFGPFALVLLDMLIEKVTAQDLDYDIWYTLTLTAGPYNTSWIDFFQALAHAPTGDDAINLGAGSPLVIAAPFSESWSWGESVTQTVTTCLICNVGTLCGVGQLVC
jgi:hypothetical protein